ncbi:MAG: 2,3-bisphosphoglycerate-independent phosphoglycerate mutase [Nitrospirae bacterium]|nr:2,3-bisphosphoglycerate-independent phosphoglycerate mutase [Nitrospirota bacterium]
MRPSVLIVLDGWGIGSDPEINAQEKADIHFYKSLLKEYPHTSLQCSGESVGLPEGTMGNSEVGHLNLGAGRIVYQDLTRINKAIKDGSFYNNAAFNSAIDAAVKNGSALHLLGLLSDGGVHSHISHLYALIDLALNKGLKKIFIHAFMDGRDTPPESGINYINALEDFIKDKPSVKIATVIGRYWAMDRDKRWERVALAYKTLANGEGKRCRSAKEAVEESYRINEADEFIKPCVIVDKSGIIGNITDGDSVIFFNFRADRAREITIALTDKNFNGFNREKLPEPGSFVTMTMYEEAFPFQAAYPPVRLTNILGEVLSRNSMKQLRIAETEKYAHVTYFFNGGEEEPFPGEDRALIPSPKEVATYDLKPEMSAYEVTDEVLKRLDTKAYDFILLNFANPDMVGHTGIMKAAVKACETIDKCLKKIVEKVSSIGGLVIITSDHGNCDRMMDGKTPHTAHTTNPVPFILLKQGVRLRDKGILADVAPTLLELMGIEKPEEMTGVSLIVK